MNPPGIEQPKLNSKLICLEDLISSIGARVLEQDVLAGQLIPKNPTSQHVLENIGARIDESCSRLEQILKAVSLL